MSNDTRSELKNNILKLIKTKMNTIDKEYLDIISEYGNIDTDVVFNVPNKNVRIYLDKLVTQFETLEQIYKEIDEKEV